MLPWEMSPGGPAPCLPAARPPSACATQKVTGAAAVPPRGLFLGPPARVARAQWGRGRQRRGLGLDPASSPPFRSPRRPPPLGLQGSPRPFPSPLPCGVPRPPATHSWSRVTLGLNPISLPPSSWVSDSQPHAAGGEREKVRVRPLRGRWASRPKWR